MRKDAGLAQSAGGGGKVPFALFILSASLYHHPSTTALDHTKGTKVTRKNGQKKRRRRKKKKWIRKASAASILQQQQHSSSPLQQQSKKNQSQIKATARAHTWELCTASGNCVMLPQYERTFTQKHLRTGTSLISINYPLITHTLHQQWNDYPMMRCHQQPQQQQQQ